MHTSNPSHRAHPFARAFVAPPAPCAAAALAPVEAIFSRLVSRVKCPAGLLGGTSGALHS